MRVTIDDRTHDFAEGTTVLAALRSLDVDVPTLCFDPRLPPRPVCRICVVEIDGALRPSCGTLLAEGMTIRTRSPRVDDEREVVLSLLAHRHTHRAIDDSNPYIHVDMSRCIDCFRCVRVCEELQGQSAWKVWNRGDATEIHPDSGTTLGESSCVSCGACASACPTGAIVDKTLLERGGPTEHTRTTCPYCGVGCELDVGTRDGRIVQVLPVMDSPVNKGHLCVKGRYAWAFVESGDRITTPLIREGAWRRATWGEAIGLIAQRFRAAIERGGPGSVGVLGSARSTNEENYVAQKFARVVLGTNNVDCCARVCHAPSAQALAAVFGTGAATSSFDDIERARTILVAGANATEAHPVVGARIKQRALHGANLIVIDPRRTDLASVPGAIHLALHPGTNVPLFNAIACAIVEEGLVDEAFVRDRVDEWPAFRDFVARFRPEVVAPICGVPAETIRAAARVYAREAPSIAFHGLGMTEHVQGTEGVMALANLALLTGNVGKPGAGVNPLRGQNNVQGSAHMGCEPHKLTGYVPLEDAAPPFEAVWGAPVPRAPGMDMLEMMDAARAGRLSALWTMGYDVALTNPDAAATREALGSLDFLVVQDLFLNETAREHAHVFLPAAASFEKDGTFMNAERRVQRVRRAIDPPGEARPDWAPLCDLARAMGRGDGFAFDSAEAIWEEIRRVWPGGRGITYARLERGGLQWPCASEDDPGTTMLHARAFSRGPRAALRRIEHRPTPERATPERPFLLNTGRGLYQFNAGTMTMRTPNRALRPSDTLDMAPADASRLGLRDGERVRVESAYGHAELALRVDDRVNAGELFATFTDPRVMLNAITGPQRDALAHTPEYKVTAVRVERATDSRTGATP